MSRLKWANEKYEKFLQRRFPRFFVLYKTFMKGFKLLIADAIEVHRIRIGMIKNKVDPQMLPYREMEKLRKFHRDMIKAVPLVLISIPPFANYLVFALMYLYPRQLLIRHFWTPEQFREFRVVFHTQRASHYLPLLSGLETTVSQLTDERVKSRLQHLCCKVREGIHPVSADLQAVRSLFSGPPLGIRRMNQDQLRHLCSLLFLTTRIPGFWIGQRLNSHAVELMQLDRAIIRLSIHQLNDSELKEACYVRGLNVEHLSSAQCRDWLSQWLQFSTQLKQSETSLYLHAMMLLTINYPKCPRS